MIISIVTVTIRDNQEEDPPQYKNLDASYFEDSVVYWHPASDCATIYEQLAKKKFREIVRDQIK